MLEIINQTSAAQFTYSSRNGYLQIEIFKSDGKVINYGQKLSFTLPPQVCFYMKDTIASLMESYKSGKDFKNDITVRPYKDINTAVKIGFYSMKSNNKQMVRLHLSGVRMDKNGFQMVINIDKPYEIFAVSKLLGMCEYSLLLYDMFKLQDVINYRTANKNGATQQYQQRNIQQPQQAVQYPQEEMYPLSTPQEVNGDFGFEGGFDAPPQPENDKSSNQTKFQEDMSNFKQQSESDNISKTDVFVPQSPTQDENLDDILNAIEQYKDF